MNRMDMTVRQKTRLPRHGMANALRLPLLLLVLLLAGSSPTRAISFANGDYTYIVSQPAKANGSYSGAPYFEMKMLYFDWTMYANSFWVKKPEIWVDGVKVCEPSEIAAFNNISNGHSYGGYAARDSANAVDGWWGKPYDKTQNGITYRVWFRDPFQSNSTYNKEKFSCYMRVYISGMESGSTHTVTIKGKWYYNETSEIDINAVYSFKAPTMWTSSHAPTTCNMTDYNHLTASGNLNYDYGSTTVGFNSDSEGSAPNRYVERTSLKSSHEYPWHTSTFSNVSAIHNRSDQSQKDGSTAAIEYVIPVEDNAFYTNFYKWFNVGVPGFVYPQNLTATADLWAKSITLTWDKAESNSRCKEGTWSVFRNETLIVNDLPYSTNSYTDKQVPNYDENYEYKVSFVPKNTPSGTIINSLTTSVTKMVERYWSFHNFAGVLVDDDAHVKLTWSHNAISDASGNKPYTLSLYRSGDGGETWGSAIYTTNITSSSTTEGTYTDTQDLQANHTYVYKLAINLLEKDFSATSAPITLGGSQLTDFTASRGDYNNVVKLSWTVKQVGVDATNFAIARRPLGSDDEKDWATIYTTSGTGSSYSYDDNTAQQGTYNEYKVSIVDRDSPSITYGYITTDGFTYSTGVISGRIKYGTGTAVEGVKVKLKQQTADGDLTTAGMRSLQFSGSGAGMGYYTTSDEIQRLFGGDFSVQMWVKPSKAEMGACGQDYLLFYADGVFSVNLWYHEADSTYQVGGRIGDDGQSPIYIPADKWSHLTFSHSNENATTTVTVATPDTIVKANILAGKTIDWTAGTASSIVVGNNGSMNAPNNYRGYMDEIRVFTKALTDKEVERNYNHPLAGNESGLAIYYPFDEGLSKQTIAYDYSKTNGVANGRHARSNVSAFSSTEQPAEKQLCMMNYTDSLGNYTIRGIHFQGEGTAYSVIPEYNIHEFSPSAKSCFISTSSLVHSGIDFDDVSSFPVKGVVYYADTDYPVEGVELYIDGQICSRDGEVITTDAQGRYEISVPIGEHFIQVKKSGHEFVNAGRYPADPNNLGNVRKTFVSGISNLTFYDATLVNFSGRVVGGDIEGQKPIGFGLSTNNIGKATLMLLPDMWETYHTNVVRGEAAGGTVATCDPNPNVLAVESAKPGTINSTSWRGAGISDCSKFFIETDPATGEFSAMLPPLNYTLESIHVAATGIDVISDPMTVNLTQPMVTTTDSVEVVDGIFERYECNTLLRQTYHSTPSFTVRQKDRPEGFFGIDDYTIKDAQGELRLTDFFDGGTYTYGFPIFVGMDTYVFELKGFERYENKDSGEPVVSDVPLAGNIVTIANELSSEQTIYTEDNTAGAAAGTVAELAENQLQLDSIGQATYKWKAGVPNITGNYTRTINIYYDIAGRTYPWTGNPMPGIVLGSLPTGNNFVTAGPDVIDMVLRDPPGTGSSLEWTKGTSYSFSHTNGTVWSSDEHVLTTTKLGVSSTLGTGFGTMKIDELESKFDLEVGVNVITENEDASSWTRTITNTKTISTSGEPDYVGADGDVFIGSSTNLIYGMARNLDLHRVGTTNTAAPAVKDIVTTGLQFNTEFLYTQKYIKEWLIPHYKEIRNAKLQQVATVEGYTNTGTQPIYITTLDPDDERFGSSNHDAAVWGNDATPGPSKTGPSYMMIIPQGSGESYEDSVEWCNSQIRIWEKHLADNEQAKVEAYEQRTLLEVFGMAKNYSFDSGSSVNESAEESYATGHSYESTVTGIAHLGGKFGVSFNDVGVMWEISTDAGGGTHETEESELEKTTSFSFTLVEDGSSDALSVDVYQYGSYSPIFRTRAGQTSNPYEGKVVTDYYQPGTTIMEATMQIEVPKIHLESDAIVSDIPTGSAANYTLSLSNQSEIGADVAYKIFVLDETNPFGAQITIDGMTLSEEGRLIKVPGNQSLTKSLQLRQTDQGVLEYNGNYDEYDELWKRGIGIVFASESQPEDIADTVFIKANFVPSSSPVTLVLSTATMNTETNDKLTLTFKDFDRNYKNLKAFRLQYKKPGAASWTLFHEYVVNAGDADPAMNSEPLPAMGASVSYTKDMATDADGEYLFRVVSVATYGAGEVYRYSEELVLVKDMVKPRPLGQPEPADGVLDIGDELSITFNEPFLKGQLTSEGNFLITGVLNGAEIDHETALSVNSGSAAAAAQTEASINLANKDFSIDTWVNITSAGTLLSHGQGSTKLTVGTNDDGKFVVSIGGNTYTSSNSVPTGKWAFLTMNVTGDGKLSATVASADETVELFSNKEVTTYAGNGPLSVGCGSSAAMHELLLWDEAHDLTTALLNRSKSKTPSTRHLIGYWKMDEGEGTTIRDYSRNRHMTMADETWYLNNENKAVSLDGDHYVSINAATLPTTDADDYAIEFWMRGSEQGGEAQLLQAGDVALWLNEEGQLQLTGKNAYSPTDATTLYASSAALNDNTWHHIALNVLRQGVAALYVDGKRCLTTNAANVRSIVTNKLIVGARRISNYEEGYSEPTYTYDRPFRGEIDEVRVWGATMNGDQIAKNRKVRFTGSEPGLIAYYPFETKKLDDYNQVITMGTPDDLTGSGLSAQLCSMLNSQCSMEYTDDAPALRTKPVETNVSFTYTASSEKIVIDIDEDPAAIEGTTLNFTVRSVRDVNGNYSDPVIWSAFVNRNELTWQEDVVSIQQQVKNGSSFTATIVNKGGQQQTWILSGMPSWLTASAEYGTTSPRGTTDVTFTVSPATPIGKYEETLYLEGNNGIETPLTVNVKVTGATPDWAVNPADFEKSMNVIGRVEIDGVPMDDEDDILAAFIGEECRGLAHPVYKERYDCSFVTMDIYGNNDKGQEVTFRAYDASTGLLYPVVTPDRAITFTPLALTGKYNEPVVMTVQDLIEQQTELKAGWNWLSLYVVPNDMTVPAIFEKVSDAVLNVKSQSDGWLSYEDGSWSGDLQRMMNEQMYSVQMSADRTLRIVGQRINPASAVIAVEPGWNWIGYYGRQVASVDDALAGLNPEDGDILKGQRGVTYFDSYEWSGSLVMMEPGIGYMLKSIADHDRLFSYPSFTVSSAYGLRRVMNSVDGAPEGETATVFTPVNFRNYANNAMMTVLLMESGTILADTEFGVFAGDECRVAGRTSAAGIVFLTIPGDDDVELSFKAVVGDEVVEAPQTVGYEVDGVYGTPKNPMVIDLKDAGTGLSSIRRTDGQAVYNVAGQRLNKPQKGINVLNNRKVLVK